MRMGHRAVSAAAWREHPDTLQHPQAAAADELQACRTGNDLVHAGRTRRHHGRGTRSACYLELPAQHHGNPAVAPARPQIHADHGRAFLLLQQGGVSTQRLIRQMTGNTTLNMRLCPVCTVSLLNRRASLLRPPVGPGCRDRRSRKPTSSDCRGNPPGAARILPRKTPVRAGSGRNAGAGEALRHEADSP
jgi:hypothetical protein